MISLLPLLLRANAKNLSFNSIGHSKFWANQYGTLDRGKIWWFWSQMGKEKKKNWLEKALGEVMKTRYLQKTTSKNSAPSLLPPRSDHPSLSCQRVTNQMVTFLLYACNN